MKRTLDNGAVLEVCFTRKGWYLGLTDPDGMGFQMVSPYFYGGDERDQADELAAWPRLYTPGLATRMPERSAA